MPCSLQAPSISKLFPYESHFPRWKIPLDPGGKTTSTSLSPCQIDNSKLLSSTNSNSLFSVLLSILISRTRTPKCYRSPIVSNFKPVQLSARKSKVSFQQNIKLFFATTRSNKRPVVLTDAILGLQPLRLSSVLSRAVWKLL